MTLIHASMGSSSASASAVRTAVSAAERTICVAMERRTPALSRAPTKHDVTVQKPALAPKANCRKIIASEAVSFTPATSLAVSV